MLTMKIIVLAILSIFVLSAFALPALAATYNPGVTVGQYIKYGNFVGNGQGFEVFSDISFQQFQVTDVSGSQVTLISTGQYKNGTALPGNGTIEVWDVATGTQNGNPDTQGPIMAANLNQGDAIPPLNTYTINSTEERSYLNVNRYVNLLTVTLNTSDYNTTLSYVYDKVSGLLLEASTVTVTQSEPLPVTSGYSYSIIETNVFSTAKPGNSSGINSYLIAVAIIAIAALVVVLIAFRKRL